MRRALNILVAESVGFPPAAAEQLRCVGHLTRADLQQDELCASVHGVDVLWVRLRHFIGPKVLQAAPRLRWIATPTTGLNHIDLEAADRRGISVVSLRGQAAFLQDVRATAELTIALMLALLRHLPAAMQSVNRGQWDRDRFRGGELYGRSVAIVGYGRLGRIVGRYLTGFGATVLAADRQPVAPEPGVTVGELHDVLRHADIVSLHADSRDDNRGFFDRRCFLSMKRGSLFVNTARGELVEECALLDALMSGHLAGAALDVLSGEQSETRTGNRLLRYAAENENLLITPHIGGCTAESMSKAEVYLARLVVEAVIKAQESLLPHPPESAGRPAVFAQEASRG
jgi:D-3-phosphoglycerate dehydrogenase